LEILVDLSFCMVCVLISPIMSTEHICLRSRMRLQAQYQGRRYEIDECEECGAVRLTTGPDVDQQKVYTILPTDPAFAEVLDYFEHLISAVRNKR
jgi:hypothetical protein